MPYELALDPLRQQFKVVLFGTDCGNKAFIFRFINGTFVDKGSGTMKTTPAAKSPWFGEKYSVVGIQEDSYRKDVQVDGVSFMLEILAPAGTEQFTGMRDLLMKDAHGFILLYSITSRSSFSDLQDVRDQIVRVKDREDFPSVLVGNKCDLEEQRVISKQDGQNLAAKFNNCSFLEASAKFGLNVNEVFYDLVRQMNGSPKPVLLSAKEREKREKEKGKKTKEDEKLLEMKKHVATAMKAREEEWARQEDAARRKGEEEARRRAQEEAAQPIASPGVGRHQKKPLAGLAGIYAQSARPMLQKVEATSNLVLQRQDPQPSTPPPVVPPRPTKPVTVDDRRLPLASPAVMPSTPASSVVARSPKKAEAIYDFKGNHDQRQLSFKKGDVLNVTNQYDNGWWAGELHGFLGYFPASYVKFTGPAAAPALAKTVMAQGSSEDRRRPMGRPDCLDSSGQVGSSALMAGDELMSENGCFRLAMLDNGDLVLFDAAEKAIWSSKTRREGPAPHRLVCQEDGKVVLYDGAGTGRWFTNTRRDAMDGPFRLVLLNDSKLVLFNKNNAKIWEAHMEGGEKGGNADEDEFATRVAANPGPLPPPRVGRLEPGHRPSPSPKQLPGGESSLRPVSAILRTATEAHSVAYEQLRFDKEAIAEGAFGKVYRVMHKASGTVYAAKVLKVTEAELDEEARDDFTLEAALLYSLRHANLVGFAGISHDPEGTIILLTEFMAGGGLNTWLYKKQHKFEPRILLRLATEIASGLAYLHSRDVVHRDLKSDNILLDEDGMHAKVADLGLAKVRSASSYYMHGQMGTMMYMAPEMLRKEKFSASADVYSFSLVVFELYTARRPYALRLAGDMDALKEAVAVRGERPVDRNNAVPPGVHLVLQRCWANDPHQRPTMSEVAEELLALKV